MRSRPSEQINVNVVMEDIIEEIEAVKELMATADIDEIQGLRADKNEHGHRRYHWRNKVYTKVHIMVRIFEFFLIPTLI